MRRARNRSIRRARVEHNRIPGTCPRQRNDAARTDPLHIATPDAADLHRKVRGALVRAGSIAAPHCMRLGGRRYHVRSLWHGDQLVRFWVDDSSTGAQILTGDLLNVTFAPLHS